MTSDFPTRPPHRNARLASLVALALILAANGCGQAENNAPAAPAANPASPAPAAAPPVAPTPPAAAPSVAPAAPQSTAPPSAPAQALGDLESLVAPIALYPDPLLAEMLVASTYPLEVVQAARWLETQPDPATLKTKDWDASILRLTEVPSILKMMNEHLDWTTQLGEAFLAKPAEVMGAIQALRKRAVDSGFLKDTPEQKVVKKAAAPASGTAQATSAVAKTETIAIEPAQADKVYVPQYNPATAYAAPLAPPPASYANAYPAAPAQTYYPAYAPPATTTTTATSSTDSLLTFGAGALVGGLLTWGIMEWTHDDDYYPVNHYYGNAVCRSGNCWYGGGGYNGGGGYYGNVDRGDVNVNRNVNVSGNQVNVDRNGYFSRDQLAMVKNPEGWRPDARHRRGQGYPDSVAKRLGQVQQPGLAGDRLGSAQTLPASNRGFADPAQGRAQTLPAERRPSVDEVRKGLAGERPGGGAAKPRPPESRGNAWEGLRESGQAVRDEERRANREPAAKREAKAPEFQRLRETDSGRAAEFKPKAENAGGATRQQRQDQQRRSEAARPNAFEGARDGNREKAFAQRGAASRERAGGGGNRADGANRGGGGGAANRANAGGGDRARSGRFQGGGGGGGGRFGEGGRQR